MHPSPKTGAYQRFETALAALPVDPDGWIRTDLRAVWVKAGGTPLSMAHTIRDFQRHGKIEVKKAGIGGKTNPIEAIRFVPQAPKSPSSKDDVLNLLRRNANSKGRVYHTVHQLRKNLSLSPHDMIKLLYDLKDAGKITFDQRGTGSTLNPVNIRLRPTAYLAQGTIEGATQEQEEPEKELRETAEPTQAYPLPEQITEEPPQEKYPLIRELIAGAEKRLLVEQATKLLEQAGLEDEAAQLLISHDTLSPIELEVLALTKEKGWTING